eukprot:TRINITY_DN2856_c0_g2_i1.p1 TRINITY_DN2856_c0_g2~~TRINITY_DN2856_c0_g2_i1.p1  ORF type:complete len:960 (-),score=188.83 TRINITY_DN2856_c0_g2_i1:533-3412(-)
MVQSERKVSTMSEMTIPPPIPDQFLFKEWLSDIVTSRLFSWFINLIIFLDLAIVIVQFAMKSDSTVFFILDGITLGIFTVEIAAKIYALERGFWDHNRNIFDFSVVLASLVVFIVEFAGAVFLSSARSLRVIGRIVRLARGVSRASVQTTTKRGVSKSTVRVDIPAEKLAGIFKTHLHNSKKKAVSDYISALVSGSAFLPNQNRLNPAQKSWMMRDMFARQSRSESNSRCAQSVRDFNQLPGVNPNIDDTETGRKEAFLKNMPRDILDDPNFDAFAFNAEHNEHGLHDLVMYILCEPEWNLVEHFEMSVSLLSNYFYAVEKNYDSNPYHNIVHVIDVTQHTVLMIRYSKLNYILTPIEKLALCIAAPIHDLRHNGLSNRFLVQTKHDLAIRYNDRSVLENYHLYCAFTLAKRPERNYMCTLEVEHEVKLRELVISLVLATDLKDHFAIVGSFESMLSAGVTLAVDMEEDQRLILMKLLLKSADCGHTCRPWKVHKRFSRGVIDEFWLQGDKERDIGIPITPFSDRNDTDIPKAQLGFISMFVDNLTETFHPFIGLSENMPDLTRNVKENIRHWKIMESRQNGSPPSPLVRSHKDKHIDTSHHQTYSTGNSDHQDDQLGSSTFLNAFQNESGDSRGKRLTINNRVGNNSSGEGSMRKSIESFEWRNTLIDTVESRISGENDSSIGSHLTPSSSSQSGGVIGVMHPSDIDHSIHTHKTSKSMRNIGTTSSITGSASASSRSLRLGHRLTHKTSAGSMSMMLSSHAAPPSSLVIVSLDNADQPHRHHNGMTTLVNTNTPDGLTVEEDTDTDTNNVSGISITIKNNNSNSNTNNMINTADASSIISSTSPSFRESQSISGNMDDNQANGNRDKSVNTNNNQHQSPPIHLPGATMDDAPLPVISGTSLNYNSSHRNSSESVSNTNTSINHHHRTSNDVTNSNTILNGSTNASRSSTNSSVAMLV